KEHPFPGEPEGSSSSGSSSSSSSSGDDATTPAATDDHPWDDKGDNPASTTKQSGRRRLPKVQNPQSDEERATEDLNVAKFYEDQGNLNAAYLRLKDAVKYQPNDSDVHFELAQLAQKMNKRDEAIAEFGTYLKLDPDGLKIKQAKKALAQLQH
ncbi:MAG TPA: tetratricopeptide repeat protein, partial [Edaphobacter sp.]